MNNNTLVTLLYYVGKYRFATILTPIFTLIVVVFDVLIPYVTARLIDDGILAGDIQKVYGYGFLMLIMVIISLCFGILSGRLGAYASSGWAANMRSAMYKNIQTFSFSNIDKFSTSGLITRMTTDITTLQSAFQMVLRISIRAPFSLLFAVFMCLFINVKTSFIFIIALIILACLILIIIKKVSPIFSQMMKKYDALNASIQENISAIRVVKAFVREDYEGDKFNAAADDLYAVSVRAENLLAFMHPIMNLVTYSCIIAIAWFGSHYVVEGSLTTGELTSLFSYIMMILGSLMMLSMIFVFLTMSAASAHRVGEVLNEKAEITSPSNPVTIVENGDISFRNVSFSYKEGCGEYAISDINLDVRPGERIGIIGATASGKSTLIHLVSRLYDVSKGELWVGEHNVKEYNLQVLRNAVSVVLQHNVLFSGTVLENLRWGNSDASLEECQAACRLACADDFIQQMPDGYYTKIEQGGTNVSGGQRQRLCIARALLKKPSILILDEATSACDTATDARIRENLRTSLPAMTQLIISQRVSTVMQCDRILIMDAGKMNGLGTHEQLLEKNSIYKEFFTIQNECSGDFDETQKGGLS